MIRVPMTDITTHVERGEENVVILVRGGWHANVPEVTPDAQTIREYTRYFQADGMSPSDARAMALDTIQQEYASARVRGLRASIRRWARIYVRRFGSIDSFDPERMQAAYMPTENTGRGGKKFVNELMRSMREESDDVL